MATLPLAAVDDGKASLFRAATMAVLRGRPPETVPSGGNELAVQPRRSVSKTAESLGELVGSHYIQPELVHPEVSSDEHVTELIRRSSSLHGGNGLVPTASPGKDDDGGVSDSALLKAKRSGKVAPAPEESAISDHVTARGEAAFAGVAPPATAWGDEAAEDVDDCEQVENIKP